MDENLLQDLEQYLKIYYLDITAMPDIKFSVDLSQDSKKESKSSFTIGIKKRLEHLFSKLEDTFADRLWKLIKKKGLTDVEVYKRANLDRRLFSKIRTDKGYKPSKNTAIALAIGLELDRSEAIDLLKRAGYAFTIGSKEDIVALCFIEHKQYDMYLINEVLDYYGLPILGERKS